MIVNTFLLNELKAWKLTTLLHCAYDAINPIVGFLLQSFARNSSVSSKKKVQKEKNDFQSN